MRSPFPFINTRYKNEKGNKKEGLQGSKEENGKGRINLLREIGQKKQQSPLCKKIKRKQTLTDLKWKVITSYQNDLFKTQLVS